MEKKRKENEEKTAEWMHKAELAVDRKDDELARAALERSMSYRRLAESFDQQVGDQTVQVENLKAALGKLEQKLAETQSRSDLLIAQHRRSRAAKKAGEARMAMRDGSESNTFDRIKKKVEYQEAVGEALAELSADTLDDRFAMIEKERQIDALLAEIKSRRQADEKTSAS